MFFKKKRVESGIDQAAHAEEISQLNEKIDALASANHALAEELESAKNQNAMYASLTRNMQVFGRSFSETQQSLSKLANTLKEEKNENYFHTMENHATPLF